MHNPLNRDLNSVITQNADLSGFKIVVNLSSFFLHDANKLMFSSFFRKTLIFLIFKIFSWGKSYQYVY